MMSSWWFWWMIFMFVVFIMPMGYGWGYRGWGPPYPSYVQRQRHLANGSRVGPDGFNHYSWSWGGDFIWMMFFVGIIWVLSAMWWPVWR